MALPFLPIEDLQSTFDELYDQVTEEIVGLWEYIDQTHLRGRTARGKRRALPARLPPEILNVYRSVLSGLNRTNNVVEFWNGKFQRLIMVQHTSIWRFIEHVQIDQRDNTILIRQLLGGHSKIKHPVQQIYKDDQALIEQIVGRYSSYKEQGRVDVYLKAIGTSPIEYE